MDIEQITFKDLVDLNELKLLFEKFSAATGFTTALVDHATSEVLLATSWRDICVKFHRACPKSQEHCKASIKELTSGLNHMGDIRIHHCKNGLVDGCTPIIIKGKHFANLFTGQILFAPPDREQFRLQAQQYGYDEQVYLASLAEVPVVSEEKFTAMLQYLAQTSSMIVQMSLFNLKSKKESTRKEALLQSVFRSAPVGIAVVVDRVFTWTNKRLSEITGYSSAELAGQTSRILHLSEEEFEWVGQEKYKQIKKYGTGSVDTRFKRKNGSIINVHLSSTPIDQQDLTAGVTFTVLDITARKQVEEALIRSQKTLRITLDANEDGILVVDSKGRVLIANRRFQELWQIPDALLVTGHDQQMLAYVQNQLIDPDAFLREVMRLYGSQESSHDMLLFEDGRIFERYSVALNLADEQARVWSFRDITERKRNETQLQQLGHLLKSSFNEIYLFDAHTLHFLQISEGAQKNLGYSADELTQLTPLDLKPEFTRERFEALLVPLRSGEKQILTFETIHCRKDGTTYPVNIRLQLMQSDVPLFVAIIQDITERKQAEAQIVKAKEEWEYTFDAIADIITIQDKDMRIVRANNAAHDFFQAKHGELNGKHCYELFTGASEPCSECPLLATLRDIGKHSIIIRHENLDKFFHVSSSAVLADNGDIQYLVHAAKDITAQKKQEQLAKQISRQQEQLKRFESLRTMAGAIAHRFNNAMMAVQGNLDLMLMTLPDNLKEKKMASNALHASEGASLVGSMLLSYLGQQPLHLQVSCLSDLAGECVSELKNKIGPSISLKYISPSAPLYCSMDKQQIKEIITNTIINAIESLDNEAGEIEISFGTDHFEMASFPVVFQDNDTKNGMYIFCQIKDTGQGIIAENLQRLFEPFFTTKFVGRGLGLALSVGIMRSHHGAVLVESKHGTGTTVRILLPGMEHSQKEITSLAGSKKDDVKLSGEILFADDDDNIRNIGKIMLEALGFTIHTAVNGLEAVEMVRRQDIDFRAVVLDISMPEMDGIEAMQRIKKSNPDLPILLSSGYSVNDFPFEKGLGTKPDGFLQKPFLFSDLQQSLEKLLF